MYISQVKLGKILNVRDFNARGKTRVLEEFAKYERFQISATGKCKKLRAFCRNVRENLNVRLCNNYDVIHHKLDCWGANRLF